MAFLLAVTMGMASDRFDRVDVVVVHVRVFVRDGERLAEGDQQYADRGQDHQQPVGQRHVRQAWGRQALGQVAHHVDPVGGVEIERDEPEAGEPGEQEQAQTAIASSSTSNSTGPRFRPWATARQPPSAARISSMMVSASRFGTR